MEDYKVRWYRDWLRRRNERKVYEALLILSMMDLQDNSACFVCDGNCELCICDDGSDCD